ncbi:CBM35 domain-containing protein [Alicyclobacillus sp. SO9]|uniref:CBM35 domain-containing protein n=1 Tax=Alicyclobacillus sp. SO9 TaxID=2665646 RepID=UPI0018E71429|nr:CBM35 domain-containing protein [Alicyclobacillus sp. SO9]QQE80530.1 carbohydrate-binding protein [Alicyclobacillus sp. SO9]
MKGSLSLGAIGALSLVAIPFGTTHAATSTTQVTPHTATSTAQDLTVNLANRYRPVTHVADGALYGLTKTTPLNLVALLKPSTFVQMAPGGKQLANGENKPYGDALKVAGLAAKAGAKVTIRMPDIYPTFPYQWVSWSNWMSKVKTMVKATMASGDKNIYAFELWNEPDWTWNTSAAGPFNQGWKRTYQEVRSLDPKAPIMGPSISSYNETFMKSFLTYCKANHCLPNVVSWHEWNAAAIPSDVNKYQALEKQLGIAPIPISIDEYGGQQQEGVPGAMIKYIAQFERAGVQSADMAFWYEPGRFSNLITDTKNANGGWWLYKWYGDMSGEMAMTTPSAAPGTSLDGIASINPSRHIADVVFGGASGNNVITIKGFNSTKDFHGDVNVELKATPWYGVDSTVRHPTTLFAGTFKISNGQISVPVKGMHKSWGYEMVVTPSHRSIQGTSKVKYPTTPHRFVLRKEAENATIHDAKVFSGSYASGAQYVGMINNPDSYVQFHVKVPSAGTYNMQVGYANGTVGYSVDKLLVNGSHVNNVAFPASGGWTNSVPNFGSRKTIDVKVRLKAGNNTITLQKLTDYAELDYIQLSKSRQFDTRAKK